MQRREHGLDVTSIVVLIDLLEKLTTTLAPREPYLSEIALPIPRAAPLTRATFPRRFVIAPPVLSVTVIGSKHHAAGGFDALAGHPVIIVGQQRRDHRTDVVRNTDPAERGHAGDELVDRRVAPHDAAAEVGGDGARRDGIDSNAARTEFLGEVAGEYLQGALQ